MAREDKGYQIDKKRRDYGMHPSGENITLEQYLERINANFDKRIKDAKREYEKISKWTTLEREELRRAVRDNLYWEINLDEDGNLIPLDMTLNKLEENRQRCLSSKMYSKWGGYSKRIIHKDNQKLVYNSNGGGNRHRVRIPSMKRSNATWKRFYELFPYYREHYGELNNKNGIKLKKVW